MTERNSATMNPMEFTYKVTKQTFSLENHFSVAKFEDEEFPLGIYDSCFSRLSGVVIEDGNVMAKDKDKASDVKCKTQLAAEMWIDVVRDIETQMRCFEIFSYSSCYTTAIKQERANREASK